MIVVDDDDDNDVNYHESDDGGDDNGDSNDDDEDNNNNNYYCDADDGLYIFINPYNIHTSNYQAYILSTTLSGTAVAINQSNMHRLGVDETVKMSSSLIQSINQSINQYLNIVDVNIRIISHSCRRG